MTRAMRISACLLLAGCAGALTPAEQIEEPITAHSDWWAGVSSALKGSEYQVREEDGNLAFRNPKQGLSASIRDDGAVVLGPLPSETGVLRSAVGSWELSMRMAGIEVPVLRVGGCAPGLGVDVGGECLREAEIGREGVTEWWRNGEDGMEQGWTIWESDGEGIESEVEFESDHEVEVEVDQDGRGARIDVGPGHLRYDGLVAWDAVGRVLPARMEEREGGLVILVEDAGAAYPITVDPLLTTVGWNAEGNQAGAQFGGSVASAGDVNGDGYGDVIVGAAYLDNGESDEGRAFLYLGLPIGLSVVAAWIGESNEAEAHYGSSVASAGDTNGDGYCDVVVGAYDFDNGESYEGRAFLYLGSASGLAASAAWTAKRVRNVAMLA